MSPAPSSRNEGPRVASGQHGLVLECMALPRGPRPPLAGPSTEPSPSRPQVRLRGARASRGGVEATWRGVPSCTKPPSRPMPVGGSGPIRWAAWAARPGPEHSSAPPHPGTGTAAAAGARTRLRWPPWDARAQSWGLSLALPRGAGQLSCPALPCPGPAGVARFSARPQWAQASRLFFIKSERERLGCSVASDAGP